MKKRVILDKKAIGRTVTRITHEILEKNAGCTGLCLIGIRTRGVYLSQRVHAKVRDVEGITLPVGALDITMYRDDISKLRWPEVKKTEISFDVNNMTVVLVDDVLHTGRTTRAAIDAIMDLDGQRGYSLPSSWTAVRGNCPSTPIMRELSVP
jgi:pyrimidine operon attenuation protein/uracil phosphoribosyltransferase